VRNSGGGGGGSGNYKSTEQLQAHKQILLLITEGDRVDTLIEKY